LPLGGNVADFASQVTGLVHRQIAGFARFAGKKIARFLLRQQQGCRAANNRTDKKAGEETTASAIALTHTLLLVIPVFSRNESP
jgi:hypothetical protein